MADQRLHQSIAAKIRRRIRDGVYKPGDRLPGERELAEEFGVSRVTIREAEIALQAQGLIRIKTGSGAYVTDQLQASLTQLPIVSALELTEARLLFESEAAALAARSISDDTLARLEELLDILGNVGDVIAIQDADREFHLTIARSSRNKAVSHVVETLWQMRSDIPDVNDVHAAVCTDESADERHTEHGAILTALRNKDPAAARSAMQDHFSRLLSTMIDTTEAQAVEALRAESAASRHRFLTSLYDSKST
ncbi:MAG: FadR/GntR family transcriptional regulator [Pseudomonadota bacterium]